MIPNKSTDHCLDESNLDWAEYKERAMMQVVLRSTWNISVLCVKTKHTVITIAIIEMYNTTRVEDAKSSRIKNKWRPILRIGADHIAKAIRQL